MIDYMVWQLSKGDALDAEFYWNMPYEKAMEWMQFSIYDGYTERMQYEK